MKPRSLRMSLPLVVLALGLHHVVPSYATTVVFIPPPPVRMVVPDARLPIQLQNVTVQSEIVGTVARTRVEMVFYNPNERVLEGELQFPLLDGQNVAGFALDIGGELRAAVPVSKEKGQQVFEDVTRARVDPALLEKTQGNNYKLRVYPLPAHGTRRVVLELDDNLDSVASIYRLPLQFAENVGQLQVTVHHASSAPSAVQLGLNTLPSTGNTFSLARQNYSGKEILSLSYPSSETASVSTEQRDDQHYFYAEITPPDNKTMPRTAPKEIGLIWDASGSGALRHHGREFALLDAYFKTLPQVRVELLLLRDHTEKAKVFDIKAGDWSKLRSVLESVVYDGASSTPILPKKSELNLWFGDGLSNYGGDSTLTSSVPLYAINSASSADLVRLRAVAEKSGGQVLNLLNLDTDLAIKSLTQQSAHLLGLHSNGAKELVSSAIQSGKIRVAGILTEAQTTLELDWKGADGQTIKQSIPLKTEPSIPFAASRWAYLQIDKLSADYRDNRAAIQRLGQRFGLVTPDTSLIVLDNVTDYVRYEITPPASLRGAYENLLAQQRKKNNDERSRHLNEVANRFAQKVEWWTKDFPKDNPVHEPVVVKKEQAEGQESRRERPAAATELRNYISDNNDGMAAPEPAPAPAPVPRTSGLAVPMAERQKSSARPKMLAGSASAQMNRLSVAESKLGATNTSSTSIQLQKWTDNAGYAKRLRDASPEQMYRVYLDERPSYLNSTAFFLDSADIFFERGQTELGLRILSNLAEMNLENRHILRILAYRLLQAKQTKLALPILQQVLNLSSNEPQSWRDLGLAYAEDGQYQLAVNHLWEVVSRPWHNRFPDVELIALAELNAILARAPKGIDTEKMDSRLLRNLPLDLRTVLTWDADNTDIDLWVTDPNGEKVMYNHPLSYQGGKISRDFTGGYGPEEFSLRVAKPGKYTIQAQFYGHRQQIVSGATTLMLRLSSDFATSKQKDQNIILRLSGSKEVVTVGTFEVGAKAKH